MNYIRIIIAFLITLIFPTICLANIEVKEDSFSNSATIYSDNTTYDTKHRIELDYGLTRIISRGEPLSFYLSVSGVARTQSAAKLLPIGMDIRFNEDSKQIYTTYSDDKMFRGIWVATVVSDSSKENELLEKIRTAKAIEIRVNYYGGENFIFRVPNDVLEEWKLKVIGYTLPNS